MTNLRPILLLILFGLAGLWAGCASTPQSRVQQNPDLFAQFSEEDKALILEGKIELGFTKDMVLLAVGRPDRKTKKTSEDGVSEKWTYYKYGFRRTGYSHGDPGEWGYRGDFHYSYLNYHRSFYPYPVFPHRGRNIKDLVVNFEDGHVVAFEEDT